MKNALKPGHRHDFVYKTLQQFIKLFAEDGVLSKHIGLETYFDTEADIDDDFEVLASVEMKGTNTDLLDFYVEWLATGVAIGIYEDTIQLMIPFSFFKDESDAAVQVLSVIRMFANGQLSLITTRRYGEICAEELVYDDGSALHEISMLVKYPWYWSPSDDSGYSAQKLSNKLKIPTQAIGKDFFWNRPESELRLSTPRIRKEDVQPLTKATWLAYSEQDNLMQAGANRSENKWSLFYRSWEFWLVCAVSMASYFGIAHIYHLPNTELSKQIVTLLLGLLCAVFITPLLKHKEVLKRTNPKSVYVRFDTYIKRHIATLGTILFGVTSIALMQSPVLTLDGKTFISYLQLANLHPWIYILPFLSIAAIVRVLDGRDRSIPVAIIAIGLGNLGLDIINFSMTNTSATTPEPYTTIVILTHLASLGLLTLGFYLMYKWRFASFWGKSETTVVEHVERITRWILVATSLFGAYLYVLAAQQLAEKLQPSMLEVGSPNQYVALTYICAGIFTCAALLMARAKLHEAGSLVFYSIAGLALVALGLGSNTSINNLQSIAWWYLIGAFLGNIFLASFYAFIRSYTDEDGLLRSLFKA